MTNEDFIKSITLDGEEWRDVVGYEGCYIVSSFGRVVSLSRCVVRGGHSVRLGTPKLLKQTKLKQTGYLCVHLSRNNCSILILTHRLVASAFIPNPLCYQCIDHIDTDRTNNTVGNLRWCSYKGNMENNNTKRRLNSMPKTRRKNGYSYQVVAIKDGVFSKTYPSISSVKEDNHDPKSVWLACNGHRIQHHGLKWMYLCDYEKSLVNQ